MRRQKAGAAATAYSWKTPGNTGSAHRVQTAPRCHEAPWQLQAAATVLKHDPFQPLFESLLVVSLFTFIQG